MRIGRNRKKIQGKEYNSTVRDYTTTWYHVSKFAPKIKLPTGKELEVATDGTGMRMSNGGVIFENIVPKTFPASAIGLLAPISKPSTFASVIEYG